MSLTVTGFLLSLQEGPAEMALKAEVAGKPARLVFELFDGWHVETTDATPVPFGDAHNAYIDRQFTCTREGDEIVFEVRDGVPGCVSVKLAAGETFIRAKDLTAIKLDRLRDEAVRAVGVLVPDPDGHEAHPIFIRTVLSRSSTRRKITPEFLAQVAEAYTKAPDGERNSAVAATFHKDERTAFRYIAAAREKGLIDG
jgi:hypothetical protein